MNLKPGWLGRQIKRVEEDVSKWPYYMRREAGFLTPDEAEAEKVERVAWAIHLTHFVPGESHPRMREMYLEDHEQLLKQARRLIESLKI